ncbi:MBL fold metallo-hydrolase [Dickeya dianthicola]|uniref:MBL fold metallo-hydrolase n=1 Tax=Dickeya dianthicola TaxID=204039 RepID=UPI0003AA48CC|nr:MBL fold metallo-hydrolase [Dickeya dianthicola]ATO32459.1 Outer membrane protein romA [Dickeya dianthicola RNS04.9]MBT1431630.1 MBL fold metallo-hydrolase [Dickeya dianthicola]MCA7003010.1 MBL fold metallo-hydrolase [Dickeya dianthicola]MCI4154186.1 MBL fold metallo-hydrolase [Dickeya dianthicola]
MADPQAKHYSPETGRFFNPQPSTAPRMSLWQTLSLIWRLGFQRKGRVPDQRLPTQSPDLQAFLAADERLKFIWFGHSTLLLNLDDTRILIDPVFSASVSPFSFMFRRFQPPALAREALPDIDIILLSHDHYDHLDEQTIRAFRDTATRFIAPLKVGEHLKKWGIAAQRIQELDWYQSHTLNGITFTATPSHHFSGRSLSGRNTTLWASWVIQGQRERLFFSGDSGYGEHFRHIGERFGPFSLAFVENGQYNHRWPDSHMHPEQTVQAAQDLRARLFMPVHWGMFALAFHDWADPVRRSSQLARERQLPIIMPMLGEVVTLGAPTATPAWWEKCADARQASLITDTAVQDVE